MTAGDGLGSHRPDREVIGVRRVSTGHAPRLQHRRAWQRFLAGAAGLVYLVVAFFVLGLFAVPSGFHGWLPTAVAYLPGLLLITVGLGIGRWPVAVAWAAGAAVLLGAWAYYQAPPIHERIEGVAAEVATPTGWTTIDNGSWSGGTWGLWASWPQVNYIYATQQAPQVAASAYATGLESDGWRRQRVGGVSTAAAPDTVAQSWTKGRWTVQLRFTGPESRAREFDTLVPGSLTRVDAYFNGQR